MWPFSYSPPDIVLRKRELRTKALAAAPDVGYEETEFTNATATQIVSRIQSGEWTASQVTEAYIKRAAFAQASTNCLTEVMFDWARKQAQDLDEEFTRTRQLRGPLHGVPTSLKDQLNITGYDSCIGFSQWTFKPASTNAAIVDQLLSAGAVIFVKTNVPQTMFAFECCNPVWGRTTNPYNDKYTCGGSSGGEGALLAMDGSAVGIGSDVGGSLRIPAAYCGIYSLKPGVGRVNGVGAVGPVPGFEGVRNTLGPMGRSIEDLELICRLTFGVPGTNQNIPQISYREAKLPEKLRFGFYTSDGFAKASPACKRAVLETVEALRKQGHECVEIEFPEAPRAFSIFVGLVSADGYKKMFSHLGPDPMEDSLFLVNLGPKLWSPIRALGCWIMQTFLRDNIFPLIFMAAKEKTVTQYTEHVDERDEYINLFRKQVWEKYNLDGIIAPVQAVPQLPNGGCKTFSGLAAATALYNLLDLPAGVVPVTHVDPALDKLTEEWTDPNDKSPGHGSSIIESALYRARQPLYKPEELDGMPVGVQIVGKKWEDEKVLGMMRVVDQALGARGFGPGAWGKLKKPEQKD